MCLLFSYDTPNITNNLKMDFKDFRKAVTKKTDIKTLNINVRSMEIRDNSENNNFNIICTTTVFDGDTLSILLGKLQYPIEDEGNRFRRMKWPWGDKHWEASLALTACSFPNVEVVELPPWIRHKTVEVTQTQQRAHALVKTLEGTTGLLPRL